MIVFSKKPFQHNSLIIAIALFACGVVSAYLVTKQQDINNQKELKALFDEDAKELVDNTLFAIEGYQYGVLGIRGVVVAHGDSSISRQTFKTYSLSRNMDMEFPGTRGFGFIRRVSRKNETEFLNKAHADDMPDFTIKEFAPHNAERYVVQYLEPQNRNLATIGIDIASEASRRIALKQAIQSGTATLTPPLSIVQSSGLPLYSFLLLLPVYHLAMPLETAEQREAATLGLSFTAIAIDTVLQQSKITNTEIALQISDMTAKQVFYSSPDFADLAEVSQQALFRRTLFGRNWEFRLRAEPTFYKHHERLSSVWLASFIIICAFLSSVLLYLSSAYRQRLIAESEEQKQLASIVENAHDAIISLNLDGVVTSWNKAADRMFDFSAEDAIGKKIADLILPEEILDQQHDFLGKIRRGEFISRHDTVRKSRNGRMINVSITYSPILDHHNRVIGTAKSIMDITEQKRSLDLFKLTIEAMQQAIVTVNEDNLITLLNQKAVDLFGYTKEELLGQNIRKLIPTRHQAQHEKHTQEFHLHPRSRTVGANNPNLSILHKDGYEIPVEIQLSPLPTVHENFTLASIVDIRLHRELQSELKNSLARMNMAVDAMNLGVWVWQMTNNKWIWDTRMFELYDAPENLIESESCDEIWRTRVHPDDLIDVEKNLAETVAGNHNFDSEFRIVLRNGTIRYLQAAAIVERDAQNIPIQVVGVNRDITNIKNAEAQIKQLNEKRTAELQEINTSLEYLVEVRTSALNTALKAAEQASHAKTDFLANMSHEIRTPMNTILGLSYLLQKKSLSPDERDMVNKIDFAGRSLLGVINSSLDFAKIENNLLTLEHIPFHLADVFDNLSNIISNAAGAKNIELLISPIPNGAHYLSGDPTRLGQVLINLTSNAIKFTEQGEVIVDVTLLKHDQENNQVTLRFSVSDTGIGIAAEKQETIFQPFLQADTSTTRVYGGTGLGLSISRHLVELMGGKLQLHSQFGVGSEFFFELNFPLSEASSRSVPCLPHQNVLIVDDNSAACSILKTMVQSLGWYAYVVNSGEQAIQTLLEKDIKYFDLLLIDWKMPGIDGLQTAVSINAKIGKEHIPVIIMVTAHDRIALLEHPSCRFVDAIISKPVTTSALFNSVLEVKIKKSDITFNNLRDPNSQRLKGVKILVVDDNETNREVAYQILGGENAIVEGVENGQEALVRLMAEPDYFDVVLMDVQMPVMDGYAATREIRRIAELKNLPIIALTAGAFKSQRDAALESGMNDFVAKPFDVNELIACVEKHVGEDYADTNLALVSAPPVLPPAAEFSDLALLDVVQGVKVWRDPEIYKKSLRNFSQRYLDDAEHIQEVLLNNDQEAGKPIVHKLLGSAGALSLKRMTRILSELEATFKKDGNTEKYLAQFNDISLQTLDAIKAYAGSNITETSKGETETLAYPTCSQAEISQLITALDSDDPELIEPKLYALKDKLPKQKFDQLMNAVENFDFQAAETLANALLAEFFNFT